MSVSPLHLQHFRVGNGGRFAFKVLFVTHLDRVGRVKSHNITVFYINSRDTVICRRNQARIIEADFFCTRFHGFIPIDISVSHSQMPLSDSSRRITALLHHLRQGELIFIDNERSVSRQNFCFFIFPRIHTGHQRITTGSGRCRSSISVREADSSMSQAIDIRSMNRSRAISTDIAKAQIIGKNHNHIRLFFHLLRGTAD